MYSVIESIIGHIHTRCQWFWHFKINDLGATGKMGTAPCPNLDTHSVICD